MGPSYDNNSGSNDAGQVGIISSSSSIPEKNKSKKLFIIICILFILLIIGGIVAFVLLNPKGGNGGGSSKEFYNKEFNMYANYLLYGEESDKAIGEVDTNEDCYIDENWSDESYLQKLLEKYNNYYSLMMGNENKPVENFLLYSSKSRLDFLKDYKDIKGLDVSIAYSRYVELGEDGLIEYLKEVYNDVDLNNQFISTMAESELDLLNKDFKGSNGNLNETSLTEKMGIDRALFVEKTIDGLKEQCEEMAEDLYEEE